MVDRIKTKLLVNSSGFTIVEVMIVLAVTGALFVSVAAAISGKQQTAQFQTSINDTRSQIREIGNEVLSGYYPSDGTYACGPGVSGIQLSIKSASAASSGACDFIGKVLHFYDASSGTPSIFSSYSIVGLSAESGTYADAKPFLVAKTDLGGNTQNVDVTANNKLTYGLTAAKMTYTSASGVTQNIGSFAFMQSLNTGVATTIGGSSQHIDVMAFPGTFAGLSSSLANSQLREADAINTAFAAGAYATGGIVTLCFNSGTTNQSGVLTIGAGSNQLDITSKVVGGTCG